MPIEHRNTITFSEIAKVIAEMKARYPNKELKSFDGFGSVFEWEFRSLIALDIVAVDRTVDGGIALTIKSDYPILVVERRKKRDTVREVIDANGAIWPLLEEQAKLMEQNIVSKIEWSARKFSTWNDYAKTAQS